MSNILEIFKMLSPGKDFESFRIGYYSRQNEIDSLDLNNMELRDRESKYYYKIYLMESLERLFNTLIQHEHSKCGVCVYCESMWNLIDLIRERIEELKGT